MKSRLLTRLDAEIRVAASPSHADCLRCERAVYLACGGDRDAAAREVAVLRQRHGAHRPRPAFCAWLNLAEGLIGPPGTPACDKIARAHALAGAAGVPRLPALCAAWLAEFAAGRHESAGVARYAAEALACAAADDHGARARAALSVAQSFETGGRCDLARPWFALAHRHATAAGDTAALGAMLWQMAVARVAAWRRAEAGATETLCEAGPSDAPGRHARAGAESTALFDRLTGIGSRSALQPLLRAQVDVLAGNPDAALALFERHLEPVLADADARSLGGAGTLLAERGWCRAGTGRADAARADAAAADAALATEAPADRAPGHHRLADLHALLGDEGQAAQQREQALRAGVAQRADQLRSVATLEAAGLEVPDAFDAALTAACDAGPRRARA